MFYKNKYFWIIITLIIVLALYMQVNIKKDKRQLTETVSVPYEYVDSSTGKLERITTPKSNVIQEFNEFYISFDDPIDKIFNYDSCGGYQNINIGRFVLYRGEAETEPKYKTTFYIGGTGYKCYGPKKELLKSKGINQDQYYYSCSGIVLTRKSHVLCD